jgi:hypothetical protein
MARKIFLSELVTLLAAHGGERFTKRFIGVTPILENAIDYVPGVRQGRNPQTVGRNGLYLLRRMLLVNDSMRCNTPAAIGIYGLFQSCKFFCSDNRCNCSRISGFYLGTVAPEP